VVVMALHALAAEYGHGAPPTPTMGESILQALLRVETMAVALVEAQVAASAVAQVAASVEGVAAVAQVVTSNWISE
jgi:hypothetical protein